MSNAIGQLVVDLVAKTAGFEAGIDKAVKSINSGQYKINKSLGNIERGFKSMRNIATTVFVGWGVGRAITDMADLGEETLKLSRRLATSTEAIGRLGFAARRSDIDFETFKKGMQDFSVRVSDAAHGTGKAEKAIAELGLSATALNNMPLEQKIATIADALLKIPNENDRLNIVKKIFGDDSGTFLDLLSQGSAGIAEFGRQAEELGLVMSTKTAEGADALNDKIKDLGDSWTGTKIAFADAGAFDIAIGGMTALQNAAMVAGDAIGFISKKWQEFLDALAQNAGKAPPSALAGLDPTKQSAIQNLYKKLTAEEKKLDELQNGSSGIKGAFGIRGSAEEIAAQQAKIAQINKEIYAKQSLFEIDKRIKAQSTTPKISSGGTTQRPGISNANPNSIKAANDNLAEQRKILDMIQTDEEKRAEEIAKANELLQEGLINTEEYHRAVGKINEKYRQMNPILDSIGDKIKGMFEGAIKPADALRSIIGEIAADWLKTKFNIGGEGGMAAKGGFGSILSDITGSIFGKGTGIVPKSGSGGGIGSWLSNIFSFDGGGSTGDGARSGGLDGKGGFIAMLHPQESVTDHTKQSSTSGGGVVIYQTNNFSLDAQNVQAQIKSALPAIAQASKQAVLADINNGGRIARAMGQRF